MPHKSLKKVPLLVLPQWLYTSSFFRFSTLFTTVVEAMCALLVAIMGRGTGAISACVLNRQSHIGSSYHSATQWTPVYMNAKPSAVEVPLEAH